MYPTNLDTSRWEVAAPRTSALLMALRICLWENPLRDATWHQTAADNMCERGVRHQGLAFVSTPVNIPWRYFVGACRGDSRGGGSFSSHASFRELGWIKAVC